MTSYRPARTRAVNGVGSSEVATFGILLVRNFGCSQLNSTHAARSNVPQFGSVELAAFETAEVPR